MTIRRVAALALTYRRPDSLARLIESVTTQELPPGVEGELFVWDNDPTARYDSHPIGGSVKQGWRAHLYISNFNVKMRAKRHLEDWCFASASTFDAVIHLDDDVVLEPGWIMACLDAFSVGFDACGSVERFNGALVCSGQTRLHLSESPIGVTQWQWKTEPVEPGFGIRPAEFAGHRAMMVRAGLARRVRHDPVMSIGGEDLDYSLALVDDGGHIALSEHARIRHRSGGEEDAVGFRTNADVIESWRRFYRKWGFVRRNAASEAGLCNEDWLALFAAGAGDNG
jgi:GT2 family glycosyltransferase